MAPEAGRGLGRPVGGGPLGGAAGLADAGVDVVARYRSALADEPVAILGLGEVGAADDAAALEPFLRDGDPRRRAAAVHALWRLTGSRARPTIVDALSDPSPIVMRSAARALVDMGLDPDTRERRWTLAASTSSVPVRAAVFRAFRRCDRWTALALAGRALATADDDLRERGDRLLRAVCGSWGRRFTRPTPAQLHDVRAVLAVVADELPDPVRRDVDAALAAPRT